MITKSSWFGFVFGSVLVFLGSSSFAFLEDNQERRTPRRELFNPVTVEIQVHKRIDLHKLLKNVSFDRRMPWEVDRILIFQSGEVIIQSVVVNEDRARANGIRSYGYSDGNHHRNDEFQNVQEFTHALIDRNFGVSEADLRAMRALALGPGSVVFDIDLDDMNPLAAAVLRSPELIAKSPNAQQVWMSESANAAKRALPFYLNLVGSPLIPRTIYGRPQEGKIVRADGREVSAELASFLQFGPWFDEVEEDAFTVRIIPIRDLRYNLQQICKTIFR